MLLLISRPYMLQYVIIARPSRSFFINLTCTLTYQITWLFKFISILRINTRYICTNTLRVYNFFLVLSRVRSSDFKIKYIICHSLVL